MIIFQIHLTVDPRARSRLERLCPVTVRPPLCLGGRSLGRKPRSILSESLGWIQASSISCICRSAESARGLGDTPLRGSLCHGGDQHSSGSLLHLATNNPLNCTLNCQVLFFHCIHRRLGGAKCLREITSTPGSAGSAEGTAELVGSWAPSPDLAGGWCKSQHVRSLAA